MKALVRAAGGASLYILGAASGFALAIPLAAVALGANTGARMAPPVASLYGPALLPLQSHMVNRTAKGARLDIRAPAAPGGTTMVARSEPMTASGSATGKVAESAASSISGPVRITPVPTQSSPGRPTPRGCLSAMGATRANLATDELTICVADASVIGRIE
jgi:hypothetical protein